MFLAKLSRRTTESGGDALDDGGQEKSKAVDWAKASHANEHEDVDLPVPNSLPYVLQVEVVGEVAVVFVQAPFDFIAFL